MHVPMLSMLSAANTLLLSPTGVASTWEPATGATGVASTWEPATGATGATVDTCD
jgi:hypothetical protein